MAIYNTPQEIVDQLQEWSDAYYAGKQQVDDTTFDALEDHLRDIDPQNAWFNRNRERAFGAKGKHIYEFIGSIDKIHSLEESKLANVPVYVSAKLDGTSMVVYFENGLLRRALTRGDGNFGMDVTQHYLKITSKYGVKIPSGFTGAIRGEVVFTNANWEEFKKRHPEAKSPRNSGTGLVNQKTTCFDEWLLDYVVYDVLATNQLQGVDYWDILTSFHYPVAPMWAHEYLTRDIMQKHFDAAKSKYPVDGLVIRAKGKPYHSTDNLYHFSKQQEAFKFQAETKVCEIEKIDWQMGKTGKLTPVARLAEPVFLSGAVVSNISLHNAANVEAKHLGPGAVVTAYRSNEVIPQVFYVLSEAKEVVLPDTCPYCGAPLKRTETGKDLVCPLDTCIGKTRFLFFSFLEALCPDVNGLGEKYENKLYDYLCQKYAVLPTTSGEFLCVLHMLYEDFDSLTAQTGKLEDIFTNSETKVTKEILTTIFETGFEVKRLLLSMNIRLLGEEVATKLARNKPALDKIFKAVYTDNDTFNAVKEALPGQDALATNVSNAHTAIAELLGLINEFGITLTYPASDVLNYFAITGALSKPRKQFQAEAAEKGWILTDNIAKCAVLVTDDPNSGSAKNVKALKLRKAVVTEEEFVKTYLGGM